MPSGSRAVGARAPPSPGDDPIGGAVGEMHGERRTPGGVRRSRSTCWREPDPLFGEPFTRQLAGMLRELRFHLERAGRMSEAVADVGERTSWEGVRGTRMAEPGAAGCVRGGQARVRTRCRGTHLSEQGCPIRPYRLRPVTEFAASSFYGAHHDATRGEDVGSLISRSRRARGRPGRLRAVDRASRAGREAARQGQGGEPRPARRGR